MCLVGTVDLASASDGVFERPFARPCLPASSYARLVVASPLSAQHHLEAAKSGPPRLLVKAPISYLLYIGPPHVSQQLNVDIEVRSPPYYCPVDDLHCALAQAPRPLDCVQRDAHWIAVRASLVVAVLPPMDLPRSKSYHAFSCYLQWAPGPRQ